MSFTMKYTYHPERRTASTKERFTQYRELEKSIVSDTQLHDFLKSTEETSA